MSLIDFGVTAVSLWQGSYEGSKTSTKKADGKIPSAFLMIVLLPD